MVGYCYEIIILSADFLLGGLNANMSGDALISESVFYENTFN